MAEGRPAAGSISLVDMHVHVDFMSNAEEVVKDGLRDGLALFANTVTPAGFAAAQKQAWADSPNVRLGPGMHPWWVADGRVGSKEVELFCELAGEAEVPFVGEVGLDFSDKHTNPSSHDRQVAALRQALTVCGQEGGKVISLHAVRAAATVLDLLEDTGCLATCACVFHWFSGSTPDLWRAIHAGCYLSVNEMQARTRRAKEQLKLVPSDHLLLETDLPPGEGVPYSAAEVEASLRRSADLLGQIRREDVLAITTENALSLLQL